MENKFPANKVEPKIYRLEDIKKSYDKDKIEGFTKYTPYRHCYRSTSLVEPNTSNSYSNPLYFRNTNFSSENFDTKYSENKTNVVGGAATSTSKYNSRPYLTSHSDETQEALASIRGVSRFGKPDYFDNCVYSKERQKREMETQKVLKEIRNKRINDHREKYRTRDKSSSRLNETIENGNHEQRQQQKIETPPPSIEKPSTNDKKEETKTIKREGKISKLIRPKSYPAENCDTTSNPPQMKTNGVSPEKTIKSKLFKRNTDKSRSPAKDAPSTDDKKSNQFLSSIEKKIRSLYSESPPPSEKVKTESPSRVQSTIRSLREQSEPRNIEHCVTESGLIKRAVSSEDFSVFGTNKPNTKTLQPSRKSVSKILGLFKKYEDKQPHGKSSKNSDETKNAKSDDSTKKKTKAEKTKTSASKNKKECTCNPEIKPNEITIKKSSSKTKTSKLPVSSGSRNSSAEPETNSPSLTNLENDHKFVPIPDCKPDRRDLTLNLNLNKHPTSSDPSRATDFLIDNREQSLPLFSPCDESNDSWSVCSDMHRQDMSPMSDNKLFSEEEANESVIDRIRRKSFYCRFNEKKKPRKTSLVDNRYDYTKYDKYADVPTTNAIKSRSLKDCATDEKSYGYAAPSSTKESKLCKRTLSMNDNYSYHKYGGSKSNANLSPEDKLLDAIDKNLNPKSKKSYLKTPTKFSDRITKSPPFNGNVGEGSPNNDVSAPL